MGWHVRSIRGSPSSGLDAVTFRALLILLMALLMALSAFVGFAVGVTSASAPPSAQLPSAPLPMVVAGRSGAPSVLGGNQSARGEVRESAVGWHPYPDPVPGGALSPAVGPSEERDLDATRPTLSVSVRETANPRLTIAKLAVGIASWHATGRDGLYAAAGPALRIGDWRGRQVEVCRNVTDIPACIVVTLNDVMRAERLIDLSDEAFAALAPLSVGLVRVSVSVP